MEACQAEITALGPTMFFVAGGKDLVPSVTSTSSIAVNRNTSNGIPSALDVVDDDDNDDARADEEDGPDFVERALSLWAESRKESLSGNKEQLNDSVLILKNTLQDVRSLAQNVNEFPDIVQADKHSRETAVALVGMLEENVSLRLKLIGKGDDPLTTTPTTIAHQITKKIAVRNNSNNQVSSSPAVKHDEFEVAEEEYEI